jgi:hypothetical protein
MITLLLAAALSIGALSPDDDGYLYKTLMVRAAPGELLEVIDLYKERMSVFDAAGEERPLWMRHSQGDQWDLLLLLPMGSFADYYSPERAARRDHAAQESGMSEDDFQRVLDERIAWREEVYVLGAEPEVVKRAFADNAYYHVEMFIALPGMREKLYEEREMENAYLKAIDRPLNLIFTRVAGATWDLYTIGFYRNIKHFAGSADITEEDRERAARAAGFEGANFIGTYMRTLIHSHNDTLATAIR